MKVILQENIANLGRVGDQVNVKPGYARNFLLPQQKAAIVTPASLAAFEQRRAELEKAAQEQVAKAQGRAADIAKLSIVMEVLASEEGKLFGSIGPREVADIVTEAGCIVTKSEIVMPDGPIRAIGEHQVAVKLHSDVLVDVQIVVNAQAAS